MLNNLLFLFIFVLLSQFSFAQNNNYYIKTDGDKSLEIVSIPLDKNNPKASSEAIESLKELGYLDNKTPIIISTETLGDNASNTQYLDDHAQNVISDYLGNAYKDNPRAYAKLTKLKAEFAKTGVMSEKLKRLFVDEYVETYKFKNFNIQKEALREAVNYVLKFDMDAETKKRLLLGLLVEDWSKTKAAVASYKLHTKTKALSRIPGLKDLSISGAKLTLIRGTYAGAVHGGIALLNGGGIWKAGLYGAFNFAFTSLIQLNSKFFEKIMSGSKLKSLAAFWGIETIVVGLIQLVSHGLQIKEGELNIAEFLVKDAGIFAGITVATQGTEEVVASNQIQEIKAPLDDFITRVYSDPSLSPEAKKLMISRAVGLRAISTIAFQKVMAISSLIWNTAAAFAAALPEIILVANINFSLKGHMIMEHFTVPDIAVYGTFAVLGSFAYAIHKKGIVNIIDKLDMSYRKIGSSIKSVKSKIMSLVKNNRCAGHYSK